MSLRLLAAVAFSADAFTGAAHEITSLPGAPAVPWKMYSGYVPIGPRGKLFFWLVESQSSTPETDPILLWTNGGPGCSGLTGFMTEHGPFRPSRNGTLELNPFAWNQMAHMVYIEQPVGVGYSQAAGKGLQYSDALAAQDNVAFVKGFFDLFPSFRDHNFYITSESYGGHYMPTLATALSNQQQFVDGKVCSFRGFIVGNPLTYLTYRNYGEFATYYGHQLLPKPLWEQYVAAGCAEADGLAPGAACERITGQMEQITAGFDPYGLDFPKCNDSALAAGRHERFSLRAALRRAAGKPPAPAASAAAGAAAASAAASASSPYPYFPADYEPCASDWATAYLSRPDVQAALGAERPQAPGGNWSACSDAVNAGYKAADTAAQAVVSAIFVYTQAAPMMPLYSALLNSTFLKMLVYSGDDDAVCATRGTQQWVWNVSAGLPLASGTDAWAPWTMDSGPGCPHGPACKQVAGFATSWDRPWISPAAKFSFVTVHGAGHLVPTTRPAAALQLLKNFLAGVW